MPQPLEHGSVVPLSRFENNPLVMPLRSIEVVHIYTVFVP